jgi:hypothetical protein
MLPVIKDDPFAIDVVIYAVEPGPVQIVLALRHDDEIYFHFESPERVSGQSCAYVFLRSIEDDGEVEIAFGAVVATGAGAEGDDLERVCGFDDATHGLRDFFFGDGPVELRGLDCHICFLPWILMPRWRPGASVSLEVR